MQKRLNDFVAIYTDFQSTFLWENDIYCIKNNDFINIILMSRQTCHLNANVNNNNMFHVSINLNMEIGTVEHCYSVQPISTANKI